MPGGAEDDERTLVAQVGPFRWTPGRVASRITGRMMEGTPAQFTRFAVVNAQADAATREVRRIDPKWRPPSGLSETIEGEVIDAETRLEAAATRLRELGNPEIREVATQTCVKPNGIWIGQQLVRGRRKLRTTTRNEFSDLLGDLLTGAKEIPSRSGYGGMEFERYDGTVFGVHMSRNSEVSIDFLNITDPSIPPHTEVHYK